MEIWKAIPGFEGYYEVSSDGRIRSIERYIESGGLKAHVRCIRDRILKPSLSNGYRSVVLWKNHVQTTMRVQHAVAACFIGPRPIGMYVCHKDGNRINNHVSNLYYGTPSENTADAMRHGTIKLGEYAPASRLSAEQVNAIRARVGAETQTRLAKEFGTSQAQISRIVNRQKWRALGMA